MSSSLQMILEGEGVDGAICLMVLVANMYGVGTYLYKNELRCATASLFMTCYRLGRQCGGIEAGVLRWLSCDTNFFSCFSKDDILMAHRFYIFLNSPEAVHISARTAYL